MPKKSLYKKFSVGTVLLLRINTLESLDLTYINIKQNVTYLFNKRT